MTGVKDTISDGLREFYEPNKKISRLQKRLIAVSVLSFVFIIMILSGAHLALKTRTAQPLIKRIQLQIYLGSI